MAEAGINQQMMAAADGQGMVAVAPRQLNPIDAVAQSRAVRHFSKLIGLAGAIAIGMVVVLWSAEPNFSPLYENMSGKDAAQAADALMSRDIEFRIDPASGSLMVDQTRLAEARLLLASQGLSGSANVGMEMLQEDQGLGTSQFMETARYNHALEAELVRSVETFRAVEKARVHLAIPEQSIFIRNRTRPSASVMVKLYPGRTLNDGQVEGVVQMIASSIPMLESSEVKVVDQFGRLLTDDEDQGMAQTTRQFDYSRKLEDSFVDRIINLLQPIVGQGNVNAQVAAQLDFSAVESTREAYDPERSVIRSEQISEEENRSLSQALGIPGALSNQPPASGEIEPAAAVAESAAEGAIGEELPSNQNRSATRNYEVDRIISHTSNPVGSIQRLSVAVVIDEKQVTADDGSISKTPYSDEEIARFVNLVKETIGFDENRGDSVSVVNASFLEVAVPEVEEIPAWQSLLNQAWIVNLIKQVLGAIGVIIVYFIFVRPLLRSLSLKNTETPAAANAEGSQSPGTPMQMQQAMAMQGQMPGGGDIGIPDLSQDPNNPAALVRRKDATYDQKVDMARSMVMDDPARVANVMKHWVGDE